MNENNPTGERMGRLIDNLLLMFIGLKLAGFIGWSWWWVLSPLWGAFLAAVALQIPGAYRNAKQRQKWQRMKAEKAARNGGE